MKRRDIILASLAIPALGHSSWVHAHHGWSSFDQNRPIYLEGKITAVKWQNPHAELELEIPAGLRLPADLPTRSLPGQSAPVDGKALLSKTVLPLRNDRKWEVELAPLTRMEAWKVAELKTGGSISLVGFTFKDEQGDAVVRVEYLFADGKVYGLRSGPA